MLSTLRDADALDLNDPGDDPAPPALEDAALRAEAAALAVKGISQVQSASAGFSRRRIHLAASNGFAGGYARSSHGLSCVAITGEGLGMERDYFGDGRTHAEDLFDAETVGRIAAERTVERAGARKPPTGAFPVVYHERISSSLIGHLLAATNGSAIARGASWARDLLGAQVLPAGLSLTEDPLRARVGGSRPFDAEGLATVRRDIVADGVLTGWTLDLATGRKLGLASTGSAARGTGGPPSPSVSNVAMTQGRTDVGGHVAGDGDRPPDHVDDRIFDQRQHRGLFARRVRLLGGKRRDYLPGQRMHGGRKPARHAAHTDARQRRALAPQPRRPSLRVEGLTIAGA
jgi:PmbA protein